MHFCLTGKILLPHTILNPGFVHIRDGLIHPLTTGASPATS
jgi:hypothetical protein